MKKLYSLGVLLLVASVLLVGCLGGGTKTKDYSIAGVVLDGEGKGMAGVKLTLEGTEIKPTILVTKEDGRWKAGPLKGTVTITPSKEGWFFSPATLKVSKEDQEIKFKGLEGKGLTINVKGEGTVLKEIQESTLQSTDILFPGTTVKLVAQPDFDWVFAYWEGDLPEDVDPETNPIIITLDQTREITAVFRETATIFGTMSLKHDFDHENFKPSGAASQAGIKKKPLVVNWEEELISDEIIVRYDSTIPFEEQIRELEAAGYTVIDSIRAQDLNAHLVLKAADQQFQALELELLGKKGILSVETNVSKQTSAVKIPSDPYYSLQWHYRQIRLPQAWSVTTGDKSVRVAVVDSGVDPNHIDLVRNLDLENAINFTAEGEENDPTDFNGHGTHVAGTIGALTSNGIGVAGVMWDVEILPVKIFDVSGKTSAWHVVKGILYAAGLLEEPFNPVPADIMNLSLGGPPSELERDSVRRADRAGTIVVAAAGNNELPVVSFPAAYPEAISVGAVGNGYGDVPTLAYYSNYGHLVDIVAPGGGGTSLDMSDWIVSTYPEGYMGMSGTSMACPHVAGVAGLMLANGIPKHEIKDILLRTSMDIGDAYYYGNGLINAYWAVNAVSEMKVMAGIRKDNTFEIVSEIAIEPKGGQFILDLVPGDYQIMAWVDVNGNGILDAGDYYTETSVIDIEAGDRFRWAGELVEIDQSGQIELEAQGVLVMD